MAWFLTNLRYVAWTALAVGVLFLIWYALGNRGLEFGEFAMVEATLRWLHVLFGIMWIGHLYYFNFTQIPNMSKIPDEQKPAIGKVIAPAALYWFRWGAMLTLISGLLLAWHLGYLVNALALGLAVEGDQPREMFIGVGMWLAIIMWFNVWFIIWPNQQKALNIDNKYPDLEAGAKDAARQTAMLFSRANTFLSVPMLVAMTGAQTLG